MRVPPPLATVPVFSAQDADHLRMLAIAHYVVGGLIALWGFHTDNFVPQRPDPARLQALLDAAPSMALFWLATRPDGHFMGNLCRAWTEALDGFGVPHVAPDSTPLIDTPSESARPICARLGRV